MNFIRFVAAKLPNYVVIIVLFVTILFNPIHCWETSLISLSTSKREISKRARNNIDRKRFV